MNSRIPYVLLLLVLGAGCAGPTDDGPSSLNEEACLRADWCRFDDGLLTISASPPGAAIVAPGPTVRSVLISDFRLAQDSPLHLQCACNVTFRDMVIESATDAVVLQGSGLLVIEGTSVAVAPEASGFKTDGFSVHVRNSTFHGETVSVGLVLRGPTLSVRDTSFDGMSSALTGTVQEASLQRIGSTCVDMLFSGVHVDRLNVVDLVAEGCTDLTGCWDSEEGPCMPYIVALRKPDAGAAGSDAHLERAHFRNQGTCFWATHFDTVAVADSSFHECAVGVQARADEVSVRNSSFHDSSTWAVTLDATRAELTGNTFTQNGWPDSHAPGAAVIVGTAGASAPSAASFLLRGNSFDDNRWALRSYVAPPTVVDARENWWGSPLGPAYPRPAIVPDTGQEWIGGRAETVLATPFLTEPPAVRDAASAHAPA